MSVPIFLRQIFIKQGLNHCKGCFCPEKSGHNRDTSMCNSLTISQIERDNRDTYVSRNRDTLVSRLSRRILLTIRDLGLWVSRLCPDKKGAKSLIISDFIKTPPLKIGTFQKVVKEVLK